MNSHGRWDTFDYESGESAGNRRRLKEAPQAHSQVSESVPRPVVWHLFATPLTPLLHLLLLDFAGERH